MMQLFFLCCVLLTKVQGFLHFELTNPYPAFDPKFYESVLDPEKCQEQLSYMVDRILPSAFFADASAKIPTGILDGNLFDLGNYFQCLSIDYNDEDIDIQGKYCLILIDVLDVIRLWLKKDMRDKEDMNLFMHQSVVNAFAVKEVKQRMLMWQKKGKNNTTSIAKNEFDTFSKENVSVILDLVPKEMGIFLGLGICIPKVCTPRQALNSSLLNFGDSNFRTMGFKEAFCRLPNDKLWTPVDTIALIVFTSIGILTLISTVYDVVNRFILKRNIENSNLQIFSAYTNGSRLVTFSSSSDTLRCLDGIRVFATLWVICGHTGVEQDKYYNAIGYLEWGQSIESVFITATPLAVDTFFAISGMLLVYTCAKMTNGKQLMKNLPYFYLNRLLRLFPILGTVVLLQSSLFHRMSDGPMWTNVARSTDKCRSGWWITLLYLQNFVFEETCLMHTWYLAVDVHLYILSPLVMFWVLGDRKSAWIALITALFVTLFSATIFNFMHNFMVNITLDSVGATSLEDFWNLYYVNVLTRASPFIVGMIFGYLLHIYRGKEVQLNWPSITFFWVASLFVFITSYLLMHFTKTENWDHQILDNLLCSFMRPVWATAVGWVVFACVHGYGGPVNWFLTLDVWRLPARLCYGAYLFHGPMIYVIGDSLTRLDHFSSGKIIFMFIAFATIAFMLSYIATVLIDGPFSTIVKYMFEKTKKKESTKL